MRNPISIIAGAVIALLGALFFLQGINVITGSGMSGTVLWSVLGPVIFVIGAVLVLRGLRGAPAADRVDL